MVKVNLLQLINVICNYNVLILNLDNGLKPDYICNPTSQSKFLNGNLYCVNMATLNLYNMTCECQTLKRFYL